MIMLLSSPYSYVRRQPDFDGSCFGPPDCVCCEQFSEFVSMAMTSNKFRFKVNFSSFILVCSLQFTTTRTHADQRSIVWTRAFCSIDCS